MPKKKNSTGAQAIRTAQRQAEALEYRLQGYSLRDIGTEMKISHVHARRLLEGALQAIVAENVEEVRKMEAQRLDMLQAPHFANALQGDMNSTNQVLRIMERRAKLFGLDAPQRTELTGKDGKDLPAPVVIDADTARAALAKALETAGLISMHDSAPAKPVLQ